MIKFREKFYSGLSDTIKGAGIGAAIGVGLNKIGNFIIPASTKKIARTVLKGNRIEQVYDKSGNAIFDTIVEKSSGDILEEKLSGIKSLKSFKDKLSKLGKWILDNPSKAAFTGALIGASLAAGYYIIKKTYNKANQSMSSADGSGLLNKVIDSLEKSGFKRGKDFTTDPAKADYLKTKVCIVISTSKDEINLMINSISDPKLESESNKIIRNLPSKTRFYKKESDKNNELTLSTIPSNMDYNYIASIAERFIRRKYPVFLIEIN